MSLLHSRILSTGAPCNRFWQEDAAGANIQAAQAAVRVGEATVQQREAMVQQARVELDRTIIRAPIDGIVVQRNVDLGQTVAASLQAPTLFTIAQDLRQMEVWASVDEGDVGRVQVGQPVAFTVAAFPGEIFRGEVKQIRLSPQVVQNVVTYVVVISADNSDMRLLPGMTATVRVITAQRENALRVPNAALRFRPPGQGAPAAAPTVGPFDGPAAAPGFGPPGGRGRGQGGQGGQALDALTRDLPEQLNLNAEQRQRLEAIVQNLRREFRDLAQLDPDQRRVRATLLRQQSAERIAQILDPQQRALYESMRANRMRGPVVNGQVWVLEGGVPRAVTVRLGVSDGSVTEILSGLIADQLVIVGAQGRAAAPAVGARPGS